MTQYAANVSVHSKNGNSLPNSTIYLPSIFNIDPCKQSRDEIERLNKENYKLQSFADLMSQQLLEQNKDDFENSVKIDENYDINIIINQINERVLLLENKEDDTSMNVPKGQIYNTLNDPSKTTGGVFMLVNPHGLKARSSNYNNSLLPRKKVIIDTMQLRSILNTKLKENEIKIMTSNNGYLIIPKNTEIHKSAILYGRLGIVFD